MFYFQIKPEITKKNILILEKIRKSLRNWYSQCARVLPWRSTSEPYNILVSEVILQQTRVNQGIDYYKRFLEVFPNLKCLAEADENQVFKLWEGLGYYSRARNLYKTAKVIHYELHGRFPDSFSELVKLPGIGVYSASAIGSIAFGLPYPAIDGNAKRVLSRLFAIDVTIERKSDFDKIHKIASDLLDKSNPGIHNQAIIELGAIICLPQSPKCSECPVAEFCIAKVQNRISDFPKRKHRVPPKTRHFNYFVFYDDVSIILGKRSGKDIWMGLFQPFLLEADRLFSVNDALIELRGQGIVIENSECLNIKGDDFKHVLSHQLINTRFFCANINMVYFPELLPYHRISIHQFPKFPVSRLISRFLQKNIPEILF
jgi:A/G-specific adenine glycosylase